MVYLISEIGVNFYDIAKKYKIGLIEACKIMIIEAKKAGSHAVKFQSYKAETLVSVNSPAYWDLNEEETDSQYKLFKRHDSFGEKDFLILSNFCRENDIEFISTPFDLNSVDYLDKIQNIYKISSSDITNYPLLKLIGSKNKKVFLSTGASTIEEIRNAVQILEDNGCPNVVIMHCVLNYPTPNNNANLNMILDIKKEFPNHEIGYSDHTKPDEKMIILTTSYLLGAEYIEKHFTLDKNIKGNDHYHSMDPDDLKNFIENIKLVDEIRGKNKKEPLEEEEKSRINARRSIRASRKIFKGEKLSGENTICTRPVRGIPSSDYFKIMEKKVNCDINKDDDINYNMLNDL